MSDTIVVPAEIVSMLNDKTDSISISKNTKGYNWDIKLYTKNLMDPIVQEDIKNQLVNIDKKLQAAFPSA